MIDDRSQCFARWLGLELGILPYNLSWTRHAASTVWSTASRLAIGLRLAEDRLKLLPLGLLLLGLCLVLILLELPGLPVDFIRKLLDHLVFHFQFLLQYRQNFVSMTEIYVHSKAKCFFYRIGILEDCLKRCCP